jgi:hypothetical protein
MEMKHPAVQYILAILTIAAAFFSWLTIHQAITDSNASTWIVPLLTFSIFFIILCLDAVLLDHDILGPAVIVASFLINWFFAFDIIHGGILVLAAILVIFAMRRVRRHMKLFIKIKIIEALGPGTLIMVLAVTLVISSQYFVEVKNVDPQQMITRFLGGQSFNSKILNSIAYFNPNLKHLGDERMTVDQFILEMSKEQLSSGSEMDTIYSQQIKKEVDKLDGSNISQEDRVKLKSQLMEEADSTAAGLSEENKRLVLEEGRKKLAELSGLNLEGTESMSFVFTNIINWQVIQKFAPPQDDSRFPLFAIVITVVLFLTIFPLGSMFRSIFAGIASLIFRLLVKTKAINIEKIPVEMERIG